MLLAALLRRNSFLKICGFAKCKLEMVQPFLVNCKDTIAFPTALKPYKTSMSSLGLIWSVQICAKVSRPDARNRRMRSGGCKPLLTRTVTLLKRIYNS
jgi:hypothetical protein